MRPQATKAAATLAAVMVLSAPLLAGALVLTYLTEYGARRYLIAAALGGAGAGSAVISWALLVRRYRGRARLTVMALALMFLALLGSMIYPGVITYSTFRLTVYGLVPVPVLDVTIGPHGGLWFRDKTHFVSVDEARPLLRPGVEVLIIGTGWYEGARVDPAIQRLEGVEIHALATPDAFALFNRLRREGRTVVLVAHTTC